MLALALSGVFAFRSHGEMKKDGTVVSVIEEVSVARRAWSLWNFTVVAANIWLEISIEIKRHIMFGLRL